MAQSTLPEPATKTLYCVAYEKFGKGKVIAKTTYLHAESANDARFQFINALPRGARININFRIVTIAPAIGAFFKQGEEDKDGAVGSIE